MTVADSSETTFPKLLIRKCGNLRRASGDPPQGSRHLAAWTWAQVARGGPGYFRSVFPQLGLKRGERVAIIGANRPRALWAMCAGQALGAIPVPIYADSVADESGLCARACGSDSSRSSRTRNRSTRFLVDRRIGCPSLRHMVYDEPRGLRDYDRTQLHVIDDAQNARSREARASRTCSLPLVA